MQKENRFIFYSCLIYTLLYLFIIIIWPLSGIIYNICEISFTEFVNIISEKRIIFAFILSAKSSFIAALINVFFGTIIAWSIVRYKFIGRRIIDLLIDLPLALPTAISGIALANIYSDNGIVGTYLKKLNISIIFKPSGIIIALIFVTLPIMVRSIEYSLKQLSKDVEEAAKTLGASKIDIFFKIILPNIFPSMLSGFALSFARGFSEYGSVIFISGNIPKFSEIISLMIVINLEQYDYNAATSISVLMLITSFIILLFINIIQKFYQKNKI